MKDKPSIIILGCYWCMKKQNSNGMTAKSRSRANYTWNLVYDKWPPIPVFLPGESHGQRGLAGYSPWGCKELDATEHAGIYSTFVCWSFLSFLFGLVFNQTLINESSPWGKKIIFHALKINLVIGNIK